MRRMVPLLMVAALALGVAACGGSSPASPTVRELSYFPASTPLVAMIATDPHSTAVEHALALANSSPTYKGLVTALLAQLAKQHISYAQDVRPLFGNPIAAGTTETSSLSAAGSTPFLAVWVTHSASTLSRLISKLPVHAAGTHDGAKLYTSSSSSTTAAVDGATLLLASSTSVLTAALDRHANGGGISSATYARDTRGLGSGALVTVLGDLTAPLSSPSAAVARKIPWVAAIRGYGIAITTGQGDLSLRYHVDTSGGSLSSSQLPIASGPASPQLSGTLPIQLALRDPAQSVNFILSAIQQAEPATYAKVISDEAAVKAATGISTASLISSLTGNLEVESDGHTTLVSVGLSDPSTISGALAKLAQLSAAATGGIRSLGGGFYALKTGTTTVTLGIAAGHLVAGNALPARLTAFASAPASGGPSGGALTFRVALPQLLSLVLKKAPSAAEQQILSLLGDLTGTLEASPSGLTGSATLALR